MQSRAVFVVAFLLFSNAAALAVSRSACQSMPRPTRKFVRHGGLVRHAAERGALRTGICTQPVPTERASLHQCDQLLHPATLGVEPMIGRVALVAFALALASPALARDPIGTAGSFRSVGWAQCSAPYASRNQAGARHPAPVDATLQGSLRARAHIEWSVALLAQTRTEEALKAANAAVAIDPTNVSSLTFRGRLLSTLLKLDAAERDLNAALMIEPTNPVLLASRAEVLLNAGKALDALADITAAIVQRPTTPTCCGSRHAST